MISLILGSILAAPRLPLVDEGKSDKQFATFRSNLLGAIEHRNTQYIQARITNDIKWSFGVENGKASFLEHWRSSPQGMEGFYAELKEVLLLGGGFQGEYFWAPYPHLFWPNNLDESKYDALAVRPDARLYEAARDDATVVAKLNYEFVKINPPSTGDQRPNWVNVSYEGKNGWMRSRDVRTPYSYRAGFQKRNGSYYMVVFIAGD